MAFSIGDIVQLNSGGPEMTTRTTGTSGEAYCQWFAGKKLESGKFPVDSLKLIRSKGDESTEDKG